MCTQVPLEHLLEQYPDGELTKVKVKVKVRKVKKGEGKASLEHAALAEVCMMKPSHVCLILTAALYCEFVIARNST